MAISTKTNKTMVKGGGDDEELDSDFYNFASKSSKKFVDPVVLTELGELWSMAAPITLMNCVVFLRAMVSVLFLGRLGPLALAGGALSIGFTNITGYSVLFGLASGLEPLCSQAYGSVNYEMLSLSLQRAFLLLFLAAVPISILWLNLGPIMVGLGQDLEITATAASFCLYSLPDLLTYIALQPLRVYLRSQGVTKPMAACSAAAVVLHVPLNFFLVFVLGLGVPGVAIASALTNFNMLMFLLIYLWWTGTCKLTWCGWASPATVASGVAPLVKLAVPSCLSVCLEWWWYEIMTVLAGYLPDPTTSVGAAAVLIQTTSLMYTVPMALAACVSTRDVFFYNKGGIPMVVLENLSSACIVTGLLVSNIQCYQMVGNELGAGKPSRARMAAMVALGCALVIGVIHVIWTLVFREQWVRLFTNDASIVRLASAVMPLMGLCELGNCPQSTGCGVLRGTARPAVGARINLFSFYLVGLPVAVSLAFGANVGFSGLWYGLFSAQVACVVLILIAVLVRTDWELEASRARKLTNVEIAVVDEEMKGLVGDTDTNMEV